MNKKIKKILCFIVVSIIILISIVMILVYSLNYFPNEVEEMKIINNFNKRIVKKGDKLKLLCWNIQYCAGKDYVFFYDLLDGSGPDEMPSKDAINKTIKKIASVINDENPDIILLQEVDDGSKRSYYEDQLKRLLELISNEYKSYTSAFYHKSRFVPHPRIMGSVGMKLSTISKFKIKKSIRHQLPLKPDNWIKRQFDLKRAVLETRLETDDLKDLVVFNTHLSAFSQGTDTLKKQVKKTYDLIKNVSKSGYKWIAGGDFNLLPNKKAYLNLGKNEQKYYNEVTELLKMTEEFKMIPNKEVSESLNPKWFTHFPNNPAIKGPDRIIDYVFYSDKLLFIKGKVRQHDTLDVSDHFPIIVEFNL